MTGRSFTHVRAGTPEEVWTHALRERPMPEWEVLGREPGRLVVVSAHPDDESLAVGGLIRLLDRRGWQVQFVVLTDGEASHPDSPTHTPEALGRIRRSEMLQAAAVLAPDAPVHFLGLPDGEVTSCEEAVTAELVALLGDEAAGTVVCAPWRGDGHPDHEAAGRAALVAASRTDAAVWEYPVWLWHWGTPADLPWSLARRVSPAPPDVAARTRAQRAHRSQTAPLSGQPGDETLLGPDMLDHFERDVEIVLTAPPLVDDALDALHRIEEDPWDVGSWYERRKRALTTATLPRERYHRALEVGGSVGALADDLAQRADLLTVVDSSDAAVAAARSRLGHRPHVTVIRGRVPAQWPEGDWDLVVVSEVGYFLSPRELDRVVERVAATVTTGGHVVLCHWRHPVRGWPLDAERVHRRFLRHPRWTAVVDHVDPDFLLAVLADSSGTQGTEDGAR